MKRAVGVLIFSLLCLIFWSGSCRADLIIVPNHFSRLTDAIPKLMPGDTLVVRKGIYSSSANGEVFPISIPSGILMVGLDRDSCILDAEGKARVIEIGSVTGTGVHLENLTVRGGVSQYCGGGIHVGENATVTFRNLHITDNRSLHGGGGIAIVSSDDVIMESCLVDSNGTEMGGGGIYCRESSPRISNTVISSNTAELGGGVACFDGSSPVMMGCTFEYNVAAGQGGGIEGYNDSSPSLHECTIRYNSAFKGGGLYLQDGSESRVEGSHFYGNTAAFGGAVFSSNTGETVFRRNVIENNEANCDSLGGGGGGGMYLYASSQALVDSNTIINNRTGDEEGSRGFGGGIQCYSGPSPIITNNVIHNNSANDEGGGIWMNKDCGGLLENNDIQYNYTGCPQRELSGVGGGVFLTQADVIVRDNLISNNTAAGRAGGLYVQNLYPCGNDGNAYPLIESNTITYNTSNYDGGGVTTSQCDSSTIRNNIISHNFALHGGGAFQVSFDSKTYISENVMENNESMEGGGGAIFICDKSRPTISENRITNNSSNDQPGGGIECLRKTKPVITENLFSNNSAEKGGAINARDSALVTISRNTFVNNSSLTSGAAVSSFPETSLLVITNNTFYESERFDRNTIVVGRETYCLIENNVIVRKSISNPLFIENHRRVIIQYNCFWTSGGDSINVNYGDAPGNIFTEPGFKDPSVRDFRLLAASPCIDAGNPESPRDPDGTIVDIGRHYFEQTTDISDTPERMTPNVPGILGLQNYPNPFNPSTTISFTLDTTKTSMVEVNIYNMRGQLVRRLLSATLPSGTRRIEWDGSDDSGRRVGSAVYFCNVRTDDDESTIKMVLAK